MNTNDYECCICMDTIKDTLIDDDNIQICLKKKDLILNELIYDFINEIDSDLIKLNCCNNKIHQYCLNTWITKQFNKLSIDITCPICRTKFNNDNIVIYMAKEYKKLYNISKEYISSDEFYLVKFIDNRIKLLINTYSDILYFK